MKQLTDLLKIPNTLIWRKKVKKIMLKENTTKKLNWKRNKVGTDVAAGTKAKNTQTLKLNSSRLCKTWTWLKYEISIFIHTMTTVQDRTE